MKKLKMLFGVLCIVALTITGCQTDAVTETPEEQQADLELTGRASQLNTITVKHNYNYNGDRFSISYTVDNESGEVLSTSGDTDRTQSYLDSNREPEAVLFSNLEDRGERAENDTSTPEYIEIDVMLFDSVEEMEAEVERQAGSRIPSEDGVAANAEGPCNSADVWGYGNFYYYKHAYYSTEMTGLRRTSRNYFRNHWVGSSYNDQMSSLIVTKPYYRSAYTALYEHSCFNGKVIGFYQGRYAYGFGIRNLKWYRMRWWRSWNDQVSSIKGWSW